MSTASHLHGQPSVSKRLDSIVRDATSGQRRNHLTGEHPTIILNHRLVTERRCGVCRENRKCAAHTGVDDTNPQEVDELAMARDECER